MMTGGGLGRGSDRNYKGIAKEIKSVKGKGKLAWGVFLLHIFQDKLKTGKSGM
jgi:hypothetical protein